MYMYIILVLPVHSSMHQGPFVKGEVIEHCSTLPYEYSKPLRLLHAILYFLSQ